MKCHGDRLLGLCLVILLVALSSWSHTAEGARDLHHARSLQQLYCMCPARYDPVCLKDGTEVASNLCNARCNPRIHVPEGTKYGKKWCNNNSGSREPPKVEIPPKDRPVSPEGRAQPVADCFCPTVYQPVCLEDGREVASNVCNVRCRPRIPVTPDMVYKEEWCLQGGQGTGVPQPAVPSPRRAAPVHAEGPIGSGRSGWSEVLVPDGTETVPRQQSKLHSEPSSPAFDLSPFLPLPQLEDREGNPYPCCLAKVDLVCSEDGTVVALNPQCAACDEALDNVPYKREWCQTPAKGASTRGGYQPAIKPACDCDEEWDPVCDKDGVLLARNRGCARCDGIEALDYMKHWCPKEVVDSPPSERICLCPLHSEPFCDSAGRVIATNRCDGECKGVDFTLLSTDNCPEEDELPEREGPKRRLEGNGDDGGETRGRNESDDDDDDTIEWADNLPGGGRSDSDDDEKFKWADNLLPEATDEVHLEARRADTASSSCLCPLIYAPVCSHDGTMVASSPCAAACKGLDISSYRRDWCPPEGEEGRGGDGASDDIAGLEGGPPERPGVPEVPRKGKGQTEEQPAICKCNRMYKPVCRKDGSVVASNECMATCSGLEKGKDFRRGWCGPTGRPLLGIHGVVQAGLASGCSCPDDWLPVCYEDGTFVSPNPCIAMCYRHGTPGRPLMRCSDTSYLPF